MVVSGLDSRENSLGTSAALDVGLSNDPLMELPGPSGCDYISDVHSLAWGLCGDTNKQHEETSFRELLFVSGNHGVTVHAFSNSCKTDEVLRPMEEGETLQGGWVDWGPSLDVLHNMEGVEDSRLADEASGAASCESSSSERSGLCTYMEAPKDDISSLVAPRRWLRTFLTKVQTVKSDGHLCTRLPEKLSFPPSANIISFSIFSDDLSILEFVSHKSPVLPEKESCTVSVQDSGNRECRNSDAGSTSTLQGASVPSDSAIGGIDSCCKILRVFSSNSYCLVGFAIEIIRHNNPDVSGGKESNLVIAVARLVRWGMQWVCSVKLDEGPGIVEWTDFKLSPGFLICLRKSGLISFYGPMSGEHIASLNLSNICRLHPSLSSLTEEGLASRHNGCNMDHREDAVLSHLTGNFAGTRRFRSLHIVSHSALLGVVDDFGVVYVIHVNDHMPGILN